MKKVGGRLAERVREERELLEWMGPRSFRRRRLRRLKSVKKRVTIRRKCRIAFSRNSSVFFSSLPPLRFHDAGAAARAHLAAGEAIYYRERDTRPGVCIKEYPDGRRELVYFSATTGETVDSILDPTIDPFEDK